MTIDHPTGEQLYEELCREAARRAVRVSQLARSLWTYDPANMLDSLRMSRRPIGRTVSRVRDLIAGRPVEPLGKPKARQPFSTMRRAQREEQGLPPSARMHREERSLAVTQKAKRAVEHQRTLSRLAHQRRMPGETLQAAASRLEREQRP